jgi:5-methyltetrahydropteroyltriglutamate--homocysteine methyltransferase
VGGVVHRQAELAIDVVNDGEVGKTSALSYVEERLEGFDPNLDRPPATRRDWNQFPGFYAELWHGRSTPTTQPDCVAPLSYKGHAQLKEDLDNMKAALAGAQVEEGFMTAVAPGWFGRGQVKYYKSEEEFQYAAGEAMRDEYRGIIEAGYVLQLDDPGLPDTWDMFVPEPTLAEYRKHATMRIEALNHALRDLPEDRIRYHICWGSWRGAHTTDIPLRDIVDILLMVKAQCYSIEAANARHEHEWKVWQDVKLPEGKILMPGVVSHHTNIVEHPEVVADRITRYANAVGRENVIAGTDCGLGNRVHEELVWAKLGILAEGAALASNQLWR